jgi:hypothetical protein
MDRIPQRPDEATTAQQQAEGTSRDTRLQIALQAAYELDADELADHYAIVGIRLAWLTRWDEERAA